MRLMIRGEDSYGPASSVTSFERMPVDDIISTVEGAR